MLSQRNACLKYDYDRVVSLRGFTCDARKSAKRHSEAGVTSRASTLNLARLRSAARRPSVDALSRCGG